ncbi:MAG: serine protease [Patescibacteria group bacterium]|jgi:S1-C subfamily serine protease
MKSKTLSSLRQLIPLFTSLTLTGYAAAQPVSDSQTIPSDPGTICADAPNDPLRARECDRRLNAHIKRNIAATVRITPFIYSEKNGTESGEGTGILIDKLGHVLTAYHIVEGAEYIIVTMRRSNTRPDTEVISSRSVPMEIVQTDTEHDLAILRPRHAETIDLAMTPAADWKPQINELLWHFGQKTVSNCGRISVWPVQALNVHGLVALKTQSNESDFGGPIVTLDGKLVGIILSNDKDRGLTFFLPIQAALPLLERQIAAENTEELEALDRCYRTNR